MRERPILFSGPMVRAILDGKKTQTRRVISPVQPRADGLWPAGRDPVPDCPFGRVGDRLWVRETWRPCMEAWRSYVEYKAGGPELDNLDRDDLLTVKKLALRFPGAKKERKSEAWHPSLHMPRWASRLVLEVTGVRVERLQEISEEDAQAEGLRPLRVDPALGWGDDLDVPARTKFSILWDKLNGKRTPWASNPWVWVVEFKVTAP